MMLQQGHERAVGFSREKQREDEAERRHNAMEVMECMKIVQEKLQNIEPEHANKIIGYLLLNYDNEDIVKFAFASEEQIIALVNEVKACLSLSPRPIGLPLLQTEHSPQSPQLRAISRPFSSPSSFRVPAPYLPPPSPTNVLPPPYTDFGRLADFEDQLSAINTFGLDQLAGGFGPRGGLRSPTGSQDFPIKACHYFYRGYCRHGNYCKFFHGQPSPPSSDLLLKDDHIFTPGSLEQLDVEISELLKSRRGIPVSIASLPSMYLEKYGKALQAEGYLTESQRHGKAGFSLTKLLARLNSIQLIDRPHGQHAVVLVEDAPKYERRNERSDLGAALSTSHQIYLTFPADSSFTDDDVMNYFKQFGPVRDVRIPRQEKRMFGFVSFHHAETVRTILSKGHPHHICGSRVLVKPYKEKTRTPERRYSERPEFPMYYPPQYFEMDPESHTTPLGYEDSSFLKKQIELELETQRLFRLQLSPKQQNPYSLFSFGVEYSKPPADNFNALPAVQGNGSTSDDKLLQTAKSFSDLDGQLDLPDSPFALA